jgi:hypothetical protein
MKNYGKVYKAELLDTNDGTGDAILQFPDELIEETGWKPGTVLKLIVEDGALIIMEKKNESI